MAPWLLGATVGCLAAGMIGPVAPTAQGSFEMGFGEPDYVYASNADRRAWLDRTVDVGATTVHLPVLWTGVAPASRPAGFQAANPADPAYNWAVVDGAVRDATTRGLRVVFGFYYAPRWAEGSGRPSDAAPGSWKPRSSEVAAFAEAAARRYSGSFPDPANPGSNLPRVRDWEVWNEPNIRDFLSPQTIRRHGKWKLESPDHYREMLNAAYRAITGVRADNFIVAAGNAPFGGPNPERRTAPAEFVRKLLCLDDSLRAKSCSDPARLDALAHHPYSNGGPRRHALNEDDVTVPDLEKLVRPLRAAEAQGRVQPAGRKGMWVTEFGWDSRPPDPDGVRESRHARWLEEAAYLFWKQGVDVATWYFLHDHAEAPLSGHFGQSGIFFHDGQSKKAAQAFEFPFVSDRKSSRRVFFWGRAPLAGRVTIEKRTDGGWRTLTHEETGGSQIFKDTVRLSGKAKLRAAIGGETSLTWEQ